MYVFNLADRVVNLAVQDTNYLLGIRILAYMDSVLVIASVLLAHKRAHLSN